MAYKFQRGLAKLSGSIQAEDGLVNTNVDDDTAAFVVAQIDAGEIPIAKLAESTISGKALGNNLDSLSKATNSGLALTSYNGSAAVSDLAVDLNDLVGTAAVNVAADSFAFIDGDDNGSKKESIADLATAQAGKGIVANNGTFNLDLHLTGGLELSGSGAAQVLRVDLETTNALIITGNGLDLKNSISGNRTFANDVVISGDLTVNGTNTILNTTTLEVEDNNIVIHSGSAPADGAGITIGTSGSPVTLQMADSAANLASSVPLKASSFIGDLTGTADDATNAANVALADESSDTTCFVAFSTAATGNQALKTGTNLTFNSSTGDLAATTGSFGKVTGDGSALTGVVASGLRFSQQEVVTSPVTASKDFVMVDTSSPREIRMPNIDAAAIGRMFVIKDVSADGGLVTVKGSVSGHNLDGEASIVLESPFAAVNLMACSASVGFFYAIF